MDERTCTYQGDRAGALIAYWYDDGDAAERVVFDAHVVRCSACRTEIAELKAKSTGTSGQQPLGADALAGALQQLTSTFTQKLDSIGRKMGVSSAVEADAPSLTALFKHEDGVKLESNMENMKVKAKSATGIAANLERLKKLKGG